MSDLAHDLKQLIALGECPCKSGAWAHWDETIGRAVKRIEELESIVERLPVTADGVPVVPDQDGDSTYYRVDHKGRVVQFAAAIDMTVGCGNGCCSDWITCGDLYSTPEAAQAARESAGGEGNKDD